MSLSNIKLTHIDTSVRISTFTLTLSRISTLVLSSHISSHLSPLSLHQCLKRLLISSRGWSAQHHEFSRALNPKPQNLKPQTPPQLFSRLVGVTSLDLSSNALSSCQAVSLLPLLVHLSLARNRSASTSQSTRSQTLEPSSCCFSHPPSPETGNLRPK